MTTHQAAVLRTVAVYGLRLGLYANDREIEDEIMRAVLVLTLEHGMPLTTHDGWVIGERPISPPPGEEKVQFVTVVEERQPD